jgi:hypothetical protein
MLNYCPTPALFALLSTFLVPWKQHKDDLHHWWHQDSVLSARIADAMVPPEWTTERCTPHGVHETQLRQIHLHVSEQARPTRT